MLGFFISSTDRPLLLISRGHPRKKKINEFLDGFGDVGQLFLILLKNHKMNPRLNKILPQKMVKQPTNCLSVFDHFVELVLIGLSDVKNSVPEFKKLF